MLGPQLGWLWITYTSRMEPLPDLVLAFEERIVQVVNDRLWREQQNGRVVATACIASLSPKPAIDLLETTLTTRF